MAIKVFNNIPKVKKTESKYGSFEELKKIAAAQAKEAPPKHMPKPVPKAPQRAPVSSNEKPSTINNGTIKPKYIQDSSVVYKKSGYVKDLLGEGN